MSFTKTVESAAKDCASNQPMLRQHGESGLTADISHVLQRMRAQARLVKGLAERHHILIGTHSAAVHALSESFERKSDALARYVETFPTLEVPLLFPAPIEQQLQRLTHYRFRHVTLRITIEQLKAATFDAARWAQWLQVIVHNALPFQTSLLLVLQEKVVCKPETQETLLRLFDCFQGRHFCVEFEHWTWYKKGTQKLWDELSTRSILPMGWDGPDLPGIVQRKIIASRRGAHVRMLGRNAGGWFDPATKYEYAYNAKELFEFANAITPERPLYITFANDPPLQALTNAIDLADVFSSMLKKNV